MAGLSHKHSTFLKVPAEPGHPQQADGHSTLLSYSHLLLLFKHKHKSFTILYPFSLQVAANGSVQDLDIPENLKDLYKTVWEIKQRVLVDMAADRGAYIDQSQSFNGEPCCR